MKNLTIMQFFTFSDITMKDVSKGKWSNLAHFLTSNLKNKKNHLGKKFLYFFQKIPP